MPLDEKNSIYSRLFHKHPDALFIMDDYRIIDCNEAAIVVFGFDNRNQLIGINPYDLSPPFQECGQSSKRKGKIELQKTFTNNNARFNWILKKRNGEQFSTEVILISKESAERRIVIAIVKDISELIKKEERIKFLSYKDNLTSLYNRDYFMKYTSNQIDNLNKIESSHRKLGVLLMDINDFKSINDNLGHDIGDVFLKTIAQRITSHLGEKGLVAKFGGDEFVILVHDIENRRQLSRLGKEILKIFDEPFKSNGYDFYVTCSLGISMYPQHGDDSNTLIKSADIALHKAKEYQGNKVVVYNNKISQVVKERFLIDSHLRYAIENDEMYLNYQPILDAQSQEIVGVEALARWRSPQMGNVPPNKFIPIAEGNGLILPIGEWILRKACVQLKKWKEMGWKEFFLSVNISIKQLEQKDFADLVVNTLDELGLDPRDLVIEITETVYMENLERIFRNLKKLNKLGIQLSIDDFGTGYSSLGQLSKLEISKLKIDKSFIKEVHLNKNDAKIVTAIISMAKSLNLSIVAEGVEENEHTVFLRNAGCDMLQGFLFSKPVSPQKIEELLNKKNLDQDTELL